ncbi:MAG: hypothetical protein C7B46_02185 [Sulfobacillus benefaciens]|uniref:Uncharacterized protein n=1 Tax=Sulfobacillus benefaciens TaxID=453960 RepID=A0A2T2XKH2_9FIRM|nr:MAG: hypothetical protein C7B46_02185 [Sulfobacillus benefaciens]
MNFADAHRMTSICDDILPSRGSGGVVPGCTIIGLNTVQQSERSVALYTEKVSVLVRRIHAVRPQAAIVAGLSTNPAGGPVTAQELARDILATRQLVSGYWLNVPAPGIGCPSCREPDPQIAVQMFALLAKSLH